MQKELQPDATIELTEREREILKLLATGLSNKEIARDLANDAQILIIVLALNGSEVSLQERIALALTHHGTLLGELSVFRDH